ncbi:MAG TPA: tRNA 2-thiouridine(34) synthase MnmA [Bacteroidales bacterium]|nr:tRNA 2-thiouridine(34) synthase MnmA [Bacteroidales bacterium]
MKKKVVIGLSGGVDSSVAAWVLKNEGYEVEALFMRNWNDTTGLLKSDCHWEDDLMFAEMVAKKLKIPFRFVDLSESYRKRVADYMFSEYEKGRTPNPDVLCNREIKFDSFAREALKTGADYMATGHYCRKDAIKRDGKIIFRLLSGMDNNKDQSYFLCQVSQKQLAKALFPIGEMTKPRVREIADELKLPTARRKDSQGICFIGKVHLPTFLKQKLKSEKGEVIRIPAEKCITRWLRGIPGPELDDSLLLMNTTPPVYSPETGSVAGVHEGAHFFTIGQRKGLNIGGSKEPLFVIGTDTLNNIVFVGEGEAHPGLYRKGLRIRRDDVHWIRKDLELNENESRLYMVRIRYRQPLQKARLYRRNNDIHIIFDRLQRGITAGQFAAWYDGDELIGSGAIDG